MEKTLKNRSHQYFGFLAQGIIVRGCSSKVEPHYSPNPNFDHELSFCTKNLCNGATRITGCQLPQTFYLLLFLITVYVLN